MNKIFDKWEGGYSEWPMTLGAAAGTLEGPSPDIELGTDPIDPQRYYSAEFMRAEWDKLWPSVWLLASATADVRESGDFAQFDIGHESFIIVRGNDGEVRAFYNVCPHRGNRICQSGRGSVDRLACPVHNWKFELDGSLAEITEEATFAPEVVQTAPGLKQVRCDTIGGLIFINIDGKAPPLREWIGLPEGYIEGYALEEMNVVRHVRSTWRSNWKTGIDIFYETYHLPHVHPQTQMSIEHYCQNDLYPNGFGRMIVPFGIPTHSSDDQVSINPALASMMRDAGLDPHAFKGNAREARRAMQHAKRERAPALGLHHYAGLTDGQLTDGWITGLFPNVQIGFHAEGAFIMRFLPHPTDPELFIYDNITLYRDVGVSGYNVPEWMGLPEGIDVSGEVPPEIEEFALGERPDIGETLLQDYDQVASLQLGLRSRGYAGPILSGQEKRIRYLHEEIDRYLSGEKQAQFAAQSAPETLA